MMADETNQTEGVEAPVEAAAAPADDRGRRLDGRFGRSLGLVGFVSHHQNSSPPSRAASASAFTRP